MKQASTTYKTYAILLLLLSIQNLNGQTFEVTPGSEFNLRKVLSSGLTFDILQDQKGLMWFATENGLIRYDGYEFKTYKSEANNPNSLSGNVISCILEDRNGLIWIGEQGNGLNCLDPKINHIKRYKTLENVRVMDIVEDHLGHIWIAGEGSGLYRFLPEQDAFNVYNKLNQKLPTDYIHDLHLDQDGTFWVGTYKGLLRYLPSQDSFLFNDALFQWDTTRNIINTVADFNKNKLCVGTKLNGVFLFDKQQQQFEKISQVFSVDKQAYVWTFFFKSKNQLWIGTRKGLMKLDAINRTIGSDSLSFPQLNQNDILKIYQSREGFIWLGTNHGVFVATPNLHPFEKYKTQIIQTDGKINTTGITDLEMEDDSILWIASTRGILRMRFETRQFLEPDHPLQIHLKGRLVDEMEIGKDGTIWAATIGNFDTQFEVFRYNNKIENVTDFCAAFKDNPTRQILEDEVGNVWFGTWKGLVKYDWARGTFLWYRQNEQAENWLINNQIQSIALDGNKGIWIGTNNNGLSYFDIEKTVFEQLKTPITHPQIRVILKDQKGQIWIATAAGLNLVIDQQNSEHFFPPNTSSDISAMVEDSKGNIWLGMKKEGLIRFDPITKKFQKFEVEEGLQDSDFWERVSFATVDGWLGLGGNDGFNIFHPDDFKTNVHAPSTLITDFQLFNESLYPQPNGILKQAIEYTSEIDLKHHQKVFTIRYAALGDVEQYAYQLEGFDADWQYVGGKREVTYTNLDAGTYFFKVKAANSNGIWNEQPTVLQLNILPPWWGTWWFYGLLGLSVVGLLYGFYRFQLKRKLAQAEAYRLKEMDRLKTKFYTNITHEFRTPLTIILGMVEDMTNREKSIELIKKSGNQLLQLVNQMLHLHRLDEDKLELQYVQADIISYLHYLFFSFETLANQKEIQLAFESFTDQLYMDFDAEQLRQILFNLMSNALKFTHENGKITMRVKTIDDEQLSITFGDTGIGIDEKELEHIFDRFYQSDTSAKSGGTGIGLALVKELIEKMSGNIQVESELGVGTTFYLQLPIMRTAKKESLPFDVLPAPERLEATSNPTMPSKQNATILVVEDKAEMQAYIRLCLAPQYDLEYAENGKLGWEKAIANIPDLIISDIMMPEWDGFELCHRLKNDQRTSHIPIILLTAKVDDASRLQGLRQGADAYLAKPFQKAELLIRIEQLLLLRRQLQVFYLRQFGIDWNTIEVTPSNVEQAFLEKIRLLVEANLENEQFSVEMLCREIGLSHPQLHRKMTALTGQSVKKFIRAIQINKAKELLTQTQLSIAEIAYQTGFSDAAYFTKVFGKGVGVSPSGFRNSL